MKINNYFIDKYLGGISDNEFMVIGCRSGFGKTSFANCLCFDAVKCGLKPALFSLENTQGDTLRIRAFINWKELSRSYDTLYRPWKHETESDNIPEYTISAFEMATKQVDEIILYENQGAYSLEDLTRDLENAKNQGATLIILDHLDFIEQQEDVFKSGRSVTNYIKLWVDKHKIPVIAFTQLAAKIPYDVIVPNPDHIYGAKDKYKLCTSMIMLDRDLQSEQIDKYLYPSYFCLRKDRYGGKINVGEIINFDIKTGRYQDQGTPIKVTADGTKTFYIN